MASTSSTAAKPRWSLADKTPLLLNLAGKDRFVDPEIPAFVDLVRQSGLKAEIFSYENTERGFDDDNDGVHYTAGPNVSAAPDRPQWSDRDQCPGGS